jgi:hypothetical protein
MKRLFLFSSFDKEDRISEPLLYYLQALAQHGDIIFVADNRLSAADSAKIAPYVLYAEADGRHGEHDWGSYKRGYLWAKDRDILKNYDRIYYVNDSMFIVSLHGTTAADALGRVIETIDAGDIGSVYYMKSKINSHFIGKIILGKLFWNSVLQSWFIGMKRDVALSPWFENFISCVGPMITKRDFISRYEVRFSHLCKKHGLKRSPFLSGFRNWPFRHPLWLYAHGAPLIKKNSVGRPNAKVNIHDFVQLGVPETQMILDELKFQLGEAAFEKLSKRTRPYVYKRIFFVSLRCHYDDAGRYLTDYYLFRWRIFSKVSHD